MNVARNPLAMAQGTPRRSTAITGVMMLRVAMLTVATAHAELNPEIRARAATAADNSCGEQEQTGAAKAPVRHPSEMATAA